MQTVDPVKDHPQSLTPTSTEARRGGVHGSDRRPSAAIESRTGTRAPARVEGATAPPRSTPGRGQPALAAARQGPPALAGGSPRRRTNSAVLCVSAIRVYEAVFRHVPEVDPDMGLGQSYDCGHRALQARLRARAWRVSEEATSLVERLFAEALSANGEDLIEAVQTFPAGFLRLVDRRGRDLQGSTRHRRRWSDQVPAGVPGRAPTGDAC